MARGGSSIQAGGLYHLISRFVGNEWLMKGPTERNMYLSLLGGAMSGCDWRCVAYALMSSHIHLAFLAGADSLASWMRPMHTDFANWLNLRLERIGAVFVRGPNVVHVQVEGTARLINYLHRNPVRAEVVSRPEDSDWTSHRAYVGTGPKPRWLDVDCGLALAGLADGNVLSTWVDSTAIGREDLDAYRLSRRKGRPANGKRGAADLTERMFDGADEVD